MRDISMLPPASTIARHEMFAPAGLLLPFGDAEDALRQANETGYGLAAYVRTNDLIADDRVA
jgi:acyl-CoA reductase-like NAD-dependent aldehyde dehydrogenase